MSIFNEYPYTNFHELNLDWITKQIKETDKKVDDFILETDDKIIAEVDQWLEDHPEATTTVQDNSLTASKFTEELRLKTLKDYITPEMFGAKGDGVTDDTVALNSAFNAAYDLNKTVALLGSYLYSDIITIPTGSKIVGFNGATLKLKDNVNPGMSPIQMPNTNNVRFYNVVFDFGSQNVLNTGIHAQSTTGMLFEKCEFKNGYGYAIRTTLSEYMAFINCSFHDIDGGASNPGGGIYGQGPKHFRILDCTFENMGDHGIYLEGDSVECKDGVISNCLFESTGTNGLTSGAAIALYSNTHHVTVDSCNFMNCREGVYVGAHGSATIMSYNIIISNCNFDIMTANGISIFGITNGTTVNRCIIAGCTLRACGQDAISIRDVFMIKVSNNIISSGVRYAINLSNAQQCMVAGNLLRDPGEEGLMIGYPNPANGPNMFTNNIITTGTSYAHRDYAIYNRNSINNMFVNNFTSGFAQENFGLTNQGNTTLYSLGVRKSVIFSNQAPIADYHNVGDMVFNSEPASGEAVGWICTVAGTPGTWRSIGTIA